MFELGRRAETASADLVSAAAHPGYAATNLQSRTQMGNSWLNGFVMKLGSMTIAQSAEQGALPSLYAATAPGVRSGQYFGPDRFFENRGHPKLVSTTKAAQDPETA